MRKYTVTFYLWSKKETYVYNVIAATRTTAIDRAVRKLYAKGYTADYIELADIKSTPIE